MDAKAKNSSSSVARRLRKRIHATKHETPPGELSRDTPEGMGDACRELLLQVDYSLACLHGDGQRDPRFSVKRLASELEKTVPTLVEIALKEGPPTERQLARDGLEAVFQLGVRALHEDARGAVVAAFLVGDVLARLGLGPIFVAGEKTFFAAQDANEEKHLIAEARAEKLRLAFEKLQHRGSWRSKSAIHRHLADIEGVSISTVKRAVLPALKKKPTRHK